MDAGKKLINDIFNGNRVLEIPFFQRSYVWDEPQWERMLDDMEMVSILNSPYFLGSVILKQLPTETSNSVGDKRTLIDGQQRLTTLNIFFKVLALKLDQNLSFDRTFRLYNNELALWHNHNDIKAFERVLNLEELVAFEGEDNISRAYTYFLKNLDPSKIDKQKVLNNIMFVGIDLDSNEDEQQIFDTINSLGVRLTTAELLKNHFFDRDDLSEYNIYWKDVFEKDKEIKAFWDKEVTTGRIKRTFIDLFFYSYLQIKIQDKALKIKTDHKIAYSKVESLFESYKSLIKNYGISQSDLLFEIKEYAILFKEFFKLDVIDQELTNKSGVQRILAIIFGLETTTLIPYLLFILKHVDDVHQRGSLLGFLESYIMRRIVVGATTRDYNRLFTDRLIYNEILTKEELKEYLQKQDTKVNFFPKDDELEKGFHESVLTNKQAAGVLYLIESKIRDQRKHGTQLLGMSRYSLEHLMPKKWVNNWPSLSSPEAIENRNRKLKTIGNLAIITQSLNSSIRDSDWKTKKEGREYKYGLNHYSSGIETLSPYLAEDDWNEEKIEERADFLYEKAREIWSINL